MKIKLLKLRENFEENFICSFRHFLSEKFGWNDDMFWSSSKNVGDTEDQMVLCVNDVLNVIFPKQMPPIRLKPFVNEFRYNENIIKRILQNIYVSLAIKPFFVRFTSMKVLVIRNPPENIKNFLILPGNHSHRVIDFKDDVSLVFAKKCFDYDYFRAEAESRLEYHFLPVPKILDYVKGRCWFSEEIVCGLPINRLIDYEHRDSSLSNAASALLDLYDLTLREVDRESYLEKLNSRIKMKIATIELYISHGQLVMLYQLLDMLYFNVSVLWNCSHSEIRLVMSHGDFQPANVICGKSNVWLTDWEYCSERSIYFDSFYYVVNSTRLGDFSSKIELLLNKMIDNALPIPLEGIFSKNCKFYIFLFLLELYLLKISEVSSAGIKNKFINLESWVNEVLGMDCMKNMDN